MVEVEATIARVEAVEAVLADLHLVGAAVDDERCDGAVDAAALALRDLLDCIRTVALERWRRDQG